VYTLRRYKSNARHRKGGSEVSDQLFVLSVSYDPNSGRLDFNIPPSAVIAAGLLMLLEAQVRMHSIAPATAPAVLVPPGNIVLPWRRG
jgi:hypothetical protein